MLLALATLARITSACWQPDPYTPPAAPGEEQAPAEEPDGAEEIERSAAEARDAAREGTPEGTPPDGEGPEGDAPPDGEDDAPAFASYRARTVQAPVTLVDDWGKPLAVLGSKGWELEVRGEEAIRTRVWCATCTPAVEGWIQAHLVERVQ